MLNLNVDLNSLNIANLEGLVDVKGQGQVRLSANANVHIDLGIDLSNPTSPRAFLYSGTTTAGVSAKIWGKDINFTASVLSLGVKVIGGSVAVDSDGIAETSYNANDKLSYSLILSDTLDGSSDGRVYFDTLSKNDVIENPLSGQLHINLPMFKASDSSSIGALDWSFAIGNPSEFSWNASPNINSYPDFNALLSSLNLSSQLEGFSGGLGDFFSLLDTAIDNQALIAKLPIIGDKLQEAVRFVKDIRDKINDNLSIIGPKSAQTVQQKIYEALGRAA